MNNPMTPSASTVAASRSELEMLYEREVATVHGFLVARCGSRTLAEDLTAEVFINAATRFSEGRGHEVSTGWLITAARRRLIDHWRRNDTQRRGLDVLRRERAPIGETEEDGRVLSALDSLAPRQRAALVLRYLDDHSVSEVADALEVDYRAAESLLARGRRSFERAYEELS
jgi:RNA polymerase sigma-70 factor (ECF subfamily)